MGLPVLDRNCTCRESQTLVFKDQNGNTYAMTGSIVTIPDYGEHPTPIFTTAPAASPLVITQPDAEDPFRRVFTWSAKQEGRKLLAADGVSVLFESPAEHELVLNGANQGAPTVVGGLRTTPSGELNHEPTIVVALSASNPPTGWHINEDGEIEDGPAPS